VHARRLPHLAPAQSPRPPHLHRPPDTLPVRSYQNLLTHLGTLNRETINFAGQRIDKLTEPTPTQRRAFQLINAAIPLTLANQ